MALVTQATLENDPGATSPDRIDDTLRAIWARTREVIATKKRLVAEHEARQAFREKRTFRHDGPSPLPPLPELTLEKIVESLPPQPDLRLQQRAEQVAAFREDFRAEMDRLRGGTDANRAGAAKGQRAQEEIDRRRRAVWMRR